MAFAVGNSVEQSGVVPWRCEANRLQVLLVTNARGDRWGIPKGNLEPFLTAPHSAEKEAYEEAGVIGSLSWVPLGKWDYRKRGSLYTVQVFPLQAQTLLDAWPESHRRRRWLPIDKAAMEVGHPGLALLLRRLPDHLLLSGALFRTP